MSPVVSMLRRIPGGARGAGYIPWERFRLHYELHGPEDGETILLIHGLLLDANCNRDLALALAEQGYRVVLLDLLGHGLSSRPRHAKWLRIDLFAEQMCACLDALAIRQAIVGGVSLGAISALQFAVRYPERVQALVLEMPVMERATPAAALMLVPLLGATRFAAPLIRGMA
ncbi:MAG: alpha/beta fold hydrolase, partial [Oceanococcaceae bacterium]